MFRIVTMCYGSETPPSPPPPSLKFIWAHSSIFLSDTISIRMRWRTVLQFPTNSYHLFPMELARKAVLALTSAAKMFFDTPAIPR